MFYEIFDQLGPQRRWWEWTLDNPMNQPFFASVPLPSVVAFAALWPMSLALCVQFFVGRHVDNGRTFTAWQLIWRTVAIGILGSIGTAVLPLPATVGKALTGSVTVAGCIYVAELTVVAAVAIWALSIQWRRRRLDDPSDTARYSNPLILAYASVYLAVMAILWATSLPAYFASLGGVTPHGDPVGSLWYAIGCLVLASLCIAAARTGTRGDRVGAGRPLTAGAPHENSGRCLHPRKGFLMPKMFACEAVGLDFVKSAPNRYSNTVDLAVTPAQLFEVLADAQAWPRWASVITNVTWTSPEPRGVGATRLVDMRFGLVAARSFLPGNPENTWHFASTNVPRRRWRPSPRTT